MPAPKSLTNALREEYETLFARMALRPNRIPEIEAAWRKIKSRASDYKKVESETGIPWFFVAIIHNLEASLRFDRHLHNGDPLNAKTVHVPAGRPADWGPPHQWHRSAIDALCLKKLEKWDDWSLAGMAYRLEAFNGWGYRVHHPEVKSPYLWSFTTVYSCGKYYADRKFSAEVVSEQCGALALLRFMMDNDASVAKRVKFVSEAEDEDDGADPFPKADPAEDEDGPSPDTDLSPPREPGPPFPGKYLLRGSKGPTVKKVQKQLKLFGCDPGEADGEFEEVTKLAVMLFQARSSDPAGEPLEVDGVVGPLTWAVLFGPDDSGPTQPLPETEKTTSLAEKVLEIASAQVGVKEVPLGSNRGPRVDAYLASVGLPPGNFWCMAFAYWCYAKAAAELGVKNRVPKGGLVRDIWNRSQGLDGATVVSAANAQENPGLVKPGMIFFMAFGPTYGHAGIVVKNVNGMLETIEGNSNDAGHRNGVGVFRRTRRRITDVQLGFVGYA